MRGRQWVLREIFYMHKGKDTFSKTLDHANTYGPVLNWQLRLICPPGPESHEAGHRDHRQETWSTWASMKRTSGPILFLPSG